MNGGNTLERRDFFRNRDTSKSTVGLYDILFEKTIRKYLCSGISAISTLLAKEASLLGFSEDEICVLWAGIDKEILAYNENKLVHQDTKINKKIKLGLIGANEMKLETIGLYLMHVMNFHEDAGRDIMLCNLIIRIRTKNLVTSSMFLVG